MHHNLINSRVWWSSPIFFFFLIVQQNPAFPLDEGPWKTARCLMGFSSISLELPRSSQCGAVGAEKPWTSRPQLPADRSSFQRDCVALAQTCLFLSLFLKQPLVPFCNSCLQRRDTNFFFFLNQVLFGVRVQLPSGLRCLSDSVWYQNKPSSVHSDPSPFW